MNKAIIKSVQDLESRFYAGLISEKFLIHQLQRLMEVAKDEDDKEYIKLRIDRDI